MARTGITVTCDTGSGLDVELLAEASRKAKLRTLYMRQGSFELVSSPQDTTDVTVMIRGAEVPGSTTEDGVVFAAVSADVRGVARGESVSPDGSTPPPSDTFVLRCEYLILYEYLSGKVMTSPELDAFVRANAPFNAWPYLREFVDMCIRRLRLPDFVLPLYRMPRGTRKSAAPDSASRKPGEPS